VLGLFQNLTVGARLVRGLVFVVGSVLGFEDGMLMLDRSIMETEVIVSCAKQYRASRKHCNLCQVSIDLKRKGKGLGNSVTKGTYATPLKV